MASLDLSDVKLAHDSTYFYDPASRLSHLRDDLVAAGFASTYKKYLVYYDTPQPLTPNTCGSGFIDPTRRGPAGYAGVFIAPNLESTPATYGCGMMEDPNLRGGYSAAVAAHELVHTLGALDTWDTPGPPHACPASPGHACDNPLDLMEPNGGTYWLDNMYLDWGHDDYYAHSGTWWDTQDSPWLQHLNEPQYTLTIDQGAGVASVTIDLPGVACTPAATCATAWQTGTTVTLSASPSDGFTRPLWGGACGSASGTPACDLTLTSDTSVTLSYLKVVTAGVMTSSYRGHPARVQARLALSRAPVAGEASVDCRATAGLRQVSHVITGAAAVCTWAVPARLAGRRLSGRVTVGLDDSRSLARTFALKLPKHL